MVLRNSRKDIGRFLGLDQRRNGTELTHTNRMEIGIVSRISWWLISVKAETWKPCNATRGVDNRSNFSDRCKSTGKSVAWIRAEVRKYSRTPSIDQTLLRCRSREDCWKRTLLHDTWWHRTWQTERTYREYTLPGSDQSSQLKGWIRGNTKIGPVLDVIVCYHQGRYGVEIMIESLFGDKTCSWFRIVNGFNQYVTEMSEETRVESIGERVVQGNLSRRQDHNRHQIQHCLLCLVRTQNERV